MTQVAIVGVGALGSHVAQFLRHYKLEVIDFDRVEQKNVLSQFHGKTTVGKNKANALRDSFNFLFGIKVHAVPFKLREDNVAVLLAKDLILDCCDNAESRILVQKAAEKAGIPCLHGGLAADGQFARVLWDNNFIVDHVPSEGGATCEDGAHLPFIATVSALMARAAQLYLETGKKVGFSVHPTGVIST